MRIAYISYEFPPDTGKGGIGTYTRQVAQAMAGLNCNVHVFCATGAQPGSFFQDGYMVHRIVCNDVQHFRESVVDMFTSVHLTVSFQLMESAEINGNAWEVKKKYPEIPMVVRLHAPGYLVESLKKKYVPFLAKLRFVLGSIKRLSFNLGYWKPYNKQQDPDYNFMLLADFITAPSESMKQWAVENWNISPHRIRVLPNIFIPPPALLNIQVYEDARFRTVVFFGRLNVLKGMVNASKAMKKILQEYPGWQFRVIGDDGPGPVPGTTMKGWMKHKLKEVINQVTFIDGIDHEMLPATLEQAEIVLLPSLFESFSYTCVESMAAAKAVIGSRNGGMADIIKNGENGLLVDPEDPNLIYKAVKSVIDNGSARYRYARAARQSVETSVVQNCLQYKSYYQEITFWSC